MCAAEATVVMGDVLPPHITAAIVNEDNSAAAIVLVPVSLLEVGEEGGEVGGGGRGWISPPEIHFMLSPPADQGALLRLFPLGPQIKAPPQRLRRWTGPYHHISLRPAVTHPSPGPTSIQKHPRPSTTPPITLIDEFHASCIRQQLSKQTAFD